MSEPQPSEIFQSIPKTVIADDDDVQVYEPVPTASSTAAATTPAAAATTSTTTAPADAAPASASPSSSTAPPPPPELRGVLSKKGKIRTNWKKRFHVLKEGNVRYYKSESEKDMKKALGGFAVFGARCSEVKSDKYKQLFQVQTEARTHLMYADTAVELAAWKKSLVEHGAIWDEDLGRKSMLESTQNAPTDPPSTATATATAATATATAPASTTETTTTTVAPAETAPATAAAVTSEVPASSAASSQAVPAEAAPAATTDTLVVDGAVVQTEHDDLDETISTSSFHIQVEIKPVAPAGPAPASSSSAPFQASPATAPGLDNWFADEALERDLSLIMRSTEADAKSGPITFDA